MTDLPTYLLSNPIAFHAIGAMLAIVTGGCCIAVVSVIRLVVRK